MKQRNQTKRTLSILLLTAMLLSGCGREAAPIENQPEPPATEAIADTTPAETELTSIVEAADYGGYDFRVLVREPDYDSVYWDEIGIEEADGTPVADAIYDRNHSGQHPV